MPSSSSPHRYLALLASVILGLIGLNMGANVVIDPFGVFGLSGFNRRNFEPNTRVLKVEHLLKHPEFDSFILGASRANGFPVDVADQTAGGRFYNFTVAGDTPAGMLEKARWLIQTRPVRRLLVTLSFDDCSTSSAVMPSLHDTEHPTLSQRSWGRFLFPYLLGAQAHPQNWLTTVYGNLIKKDTWYTFDVTTGHYDFPLFRKAQAADPEGYAKARFPTPAVTNEVAHPDSMASLTELMELVRQRGVAVTVILNPDNRRTFFSFPPAAYRAWLTQLVAIAGEVWDFEGLNSVTTDDLLYYEQRHFKPEAGRIALLRIFAPQSPELARHQGFGTLVTQETLPARLDQLEQQWRAKGLSQAAPIKGLSQAAPIKG